MRIAYLTAGAGGMFCGSCLRDNALAAALARQSVDIELIPTYTPIRTDEENVSIDRVFFGGINVYLAQKVPIFQYLPSAVTRVFDRPGLIRWATSRGMQTDAKLLGSLTVSMLQGAAGRQRGEVKKLVKYLTSTVRPAIVNFSNLLIGGCIPALRARLSAPLVVTLQGDDIFLDSLEEPYRSQSIKLLQGLARQVDGFITFSQFYAEKMQALLEIPDAKLHLVPLGLDTRDFATLPETETSGRPPTIGYLARLAPEKGLHLLAAAFLRLRENRAFHDARLRIAGWLGEQHRAYADGVFETLKGAGHAEAFEYVGSIDRTQKLAFLRSLDVLSVPTTYHEPKGLFVLEALAAGVPVVQPAHGAFPELLTSTGGGRLVRPDDPAHLAEELGLLLGDRAMRRALGAEGRAKVLSHHSSEAMATATLEVYRRILSS